MCVDKCRERGRGQRRQRTDALIVLLQFGPLFIHPLIYFYGPKIWRQPYEHSTMQTLALVMVLFHYAKREYETLYIHRFSNGTMPLFNIFKNSFHYWVLSGVLLAIGINSPWYGAAAVKGKLQDDPGFLTACLIVWSIGQSGNYWCHYTLMSLRPAGTKQRNIPKGGLFELVSCPNYFFETITWTAFTVLTLNPASLLFAIVSVAQMTIWASKKHRNYRREFKEYPRGRKAIFPFIF
jgi:very-long-chain enoyl-CoA reductase